MRKQSPRAAKRGKRSSPGPGARGPAGAKGKGKGKGKAKQKARATAGKIASSPALPGEAPERPTSQAPPFLVAAVGASAGGLEAFTGLLRNIPASANLALLLVLHLARGRKSHLVELLSRSTALQVVEGRDHLTIEPRHVYVIPPGTRMRVADGRLSVVAHDDGAQAAVDVLFQSMAGQYIERGVAVVLSGGGSDGTAGLREIKQAGGIAFVQNPEEAKVDGMPRAAIAANLSDGVLPVDEIAAELVRLSQHAFFRGELPPGPREETDEHAHYRRIFQMLRRSSGIDFSEYKPPTIARRIHRRIALNHLTTLQEYVAFAQQNVKELEQLQEDLLIHVTSFFREPESFEALKSSVFPRLLANRRGDEPIRIWVPGCSTGEEPYSLAMALVEFLGDEASAVPIQIFGTDVSDRTVERARAGVYPQHIVRDLSPQRLRRFFTEFDGGYRVAKFLRELCVFARQDITRDPPFSKLDLVMCRNLLIYLGLPMQRKVVGVFHYALKSSGYLVLGRSETIAPHTDLFAGDDKRFKIFTKKKASRRPELEFRAPSAPVSAAAIPPASRPLAREGRELDVQAEVSRFLIDRYAPPGVVVDDEFRIIRSRGRTAPYLELPSGEVSLDVLKMARPGLLPGLRAALEQARGRAVTVRKEGLRFRGEDQTRLLDLEVTPVGTSTARQFLVIFEEQAPAAPKPGARGGKGKGRKQAAQESNADPKIRELENDLAASREHLQAIIHDLAASNEELQSANEEILSSNEELQSTNEELDTAKEELQSSNEELSTLNDELEGRNHEMTQINGDLLNLLSSVNIPIVIVSTDLRIRRFTPAAERTLNLIASDTGRPIGHIKPNIDCPDLEAMITDVIESVSTREREVEDHEGRRFALRIRPYKSMENKIEGAVLAMFDVTHIGQAADDLAQARAAAEAIMSTVQEPVLLLDGELNVQAVNPAFTRIFRLTQADIQSKPLYELGKRGWDVGALRKLVEDALPAHNRVDGFVVQHAAAGQPPQQLLVDGRRVGGRGQASMVLLIVREGGGAPSSERES